MATSDQSLSASSLTVGSSAPKKKQSSEAAASMGMDIPVSLDYRLLSFYGCPHRGIFDLHVHAVFAVIG